MVRKNANAKSQQMIDKKLAYRQCHKGASRRNRVRRKNSDLFGPFRVPSE